MFHEVEDLKLSDSLPAKELVVLYVLEALVFFHADLLCHFLERAFGRLHASERLLVMIELGPVLDHESTY